MCDSTSTVVTTTFIGKMKRVERSPRSGRSQIASRTGRIERSRAPRSSPAVSPQASRCVPFRPSPRVAPEPAVSRPRPIVVSQIIITGAQRCPANDAITPDDEPVSSHAGFTRVT